MTIDNLMKWFIGPHNEAHSSKVGEPVLVTKEAAEAAKDLLRQRSGIDFDAFHQTATAESLFSERLGPTTDCLTVREVSESFFEGDESSVSGPDRRLIERLIVHLSSCQDCSQAVELFRRIERQSMERLSQAGKSPAIEFWFEGECVVSGQESKRHIEIPVYMVDNSVADATALSVSFPVGKKNIIKSVDLHQVEILGLEQEGQGHKVIYQSDDSTELAGIQPGTCGFLEVMRTDKKARALSAGPIRILERGPHIQRPRPEE